MSTELASMSQENRVECEPLIRGFAREFCACVVRYVGFVESIESSLLLCW